ncbi:MAG: SemiSWEET family transporter [Candidatus Poseidoniaceae archaeon]|jgi:MtN3 and saliva related transmembrane protein|nr:SemiSWEET family transporter [Candidatus Poseidoniaceae archaeon]
MSAMIEAIGLSAGIIGIIAWGPQIRQVWVHKRHDGISIPTFGIVALSLFMWLLYGLAIGSMAMVISNILTLSVMLIIIIGVLRCRKNETLNDEQIS